MRLALTRLCEWGSGCKPGFYGALFEACKVCPADSYCPGGVAVNPCPALASSPPGAFECTCDPGTYGSVSSEEGCQVRSFKLMSEQSVLLSEVRSAGSGTHSPDKCVEGRDALRGRCAVAGRCQRAQSARLRQREQRMNPSALALRDTSSRKATRVRWARTA